SIDFWLGAIRGPRRRDHRHAHLWRLRAAQRAAEALRLHGGQRACRGERAAEADKVALMRIAIGCDHAGFELKQHVNALLHELGHEVSDLDTYTVEAADYSDYAERVALALRTGQLVRGIVICGSGVGASVAATNIAGLRAGLCNDTYSARQGVEHDD